MSQSSRTDHRCNKFKTSRKLSAALTFLALVLVNSALWADDLIPVDPDDPECVHIGSGYGTNCATGDAAGCQLWTNPADGKKEVNGITNNNQVSVYMNGSGQPVQLNPILLIVGVPNAPSLNGVAGAGATLPLISQVALYTNYPQTGTTSLPATPTEFGTVGSPGTNPPAGPGGQENWGGVWNTSTGFAGNLTNAPCTTGKSNGTCTAYQETNLSAGGSESFVNWSGAEQALTGITASNFGIYVYQLNFAPTAWSGNGLINVSFAGQGLQKGDFVLAYSCSVNTTPSACSPSGDIYSVPFTQVGLALNSPTTPIPEPGSLLLLGTGLSGTAILLRRAKKPAPANKQ